MFLNNGKAFKLARIGLVRAACPRELQSTTDNVNPFKALKVERNRKQLGFVADTGYFPPVVITAGAALRTRLLDNAHIFAYAFVSEDANMRIEGEIAASALLQQVSSALVSRYYPRGVFRGQTWPSVQEVYPFENMFTYEIHASRYTQRYFIDPNTRVVRLNGNHVLLNNPIVKPEFQIRAGTEMQLPTPYLTSTSPMIYQIVKSISNVDSAVADYLAAIKGGNYTALKPDFCPAQLTADHKVAYPAITARGIEVIDFARYVAMKAEATANYHGEKIPVSKVGYVDKAGNAHLPFNTPGRARNALARMNQTTSVPTAKKSAAMSKVRRGAKKHGVDVSDEPTKKQAAWKKKKSKGIKADDSGNPPAMTNQELTNTKGLALTI